MSPPAPSRRQRTPLSRVVLVSGAAVLGACEHRSSGSSSAASASSSSTPPEGLGAGARVHIQGELGRALDFAMSLDGTKDCPLGGGSPLRKEFEKIGVEVDLEATSDREIPANAFYATLMDPAGERYPATLSGCEPALPAIVLSHGEKAHGFITFAVPRLARKLELRYAPPVVGKPEEELRFAVAR